MPLPELGRPSRYVWLQVISVLFPGMLILVELWVIAAAPHPMIKSLDRGTKGTSTATLLVAGIVATATAYAVGTFSRELAFAALLSRRKRNHGRVRESRIFRFAARLMERLRRSSGLSKPETEKASNNLDCEYRISRKKDDPHPSASTPDASAILRTHHPEIGRAIEANERIATLAYGKAWLNQYRAALAVEDIGVEINIVASLMFPALLLPFAFARWWSHNPHAPTWIQNPSSWTWIVTCLLAVLLAWLTGIRTLILARYELEDVLRNLTLAVWVDSHPPTLTSKEIEAYRVDRDPSRKPDERA